MVVVVVVVVLNCLWMLDLKALTGEEVTILLLDEDLATTLSLDGAGEELVEGSLLFLDRVVRAVEVVWGSLEDVVRLRVRLVVQDVLRTVGATKLVV